MKAIFHKDINIRAHKRNVSWSIKASPFPQTFPKECVESAVERGAAEIVQPKRRAVTAIEPEAKDVIPSEIEAGESVSESGDSPNSNAEKE